MPQEAVKPLIVHVRADLKDKLRAIATDRQISMTKVIEIWLESLSESNEKGSRSVEKRKKESQVGRKK